MKPTETLEIMPAARTLAAGFAQNPFRFVPATPEVYAKNIALMSAETDNAVMGAAVRLVLFGDYLRSVKLDLHLKGEGGFHAWIEEHVPGVNREKMRVAMAVAGNTFAKNPELYDLADAAKVQRVAQLVDGRSFHEYAQATGAIKRPANVDPATGKRLHHPSAKSPVEKAEEAPAKARLNFLTAIKNVEVEINLGSAGALSDQELDEAIGALGDYGERLRQLRSQRKDQTSPRTPRRPRDIGDLA